MCYRLLRASLSFSLSPSILSLSSLSLFLSLSFSLSLFLSLFLSLSPLSLSLSFSLSLYSFSLSFSPSPSPPLSLSQKLRPLLQRTTKAVKSSLRKIWRRFDNSFACFACCQNSAFLNTVYLFYSASLLPDCF